ncbi:hypothetical protein LZG00_09620 [Rhodobacteraceae bacterium LMO-12]|nr:hypothetical protein [Rhodobacteraceae bacterium LMO-JJ12]
MKRIFLLIAFVCLPHWAMAEEADSLFANYAAYDAYVDKTITTREWSAFVKKMGGRDEYSAEELANIEKQFNALFPRNFTARTIFNEEDLGGNIRREARVFWGGGRYLFFYAIMHERSDALVVLNFTLNTKIEKIMAKF